MTTRPLPASYLWHGKPDLAELNAQIMARRASGHPNGRGVRQHGTEAGYKQHQRRGEKPCEPCRRAQNIARAERKRQRRQRERT